MIFATYPYMHLDI